MSQLVHSLGGSYFNKGFYQRCKLCLVQVCNTVATALPSPQGKATVCIYWSWRVNSYFGTLCICPTS